MNVSNLIQKMHIDGFDLYVENENIRVNSASPLNDDQRQNLMQHKKEILQYLEQGNHKPMNPAEEKSIRAWCSYIGEQDSELIEEVLSRCDKVIDARRYFLMRSKEALCSA